MIKFVLRCSEGHEAESWFHDGAAYDHQARQGLIRCPVCGSPSVSKAIMAPALVRGERAPETPKRPPGGEAESLQPPAVFCAADEKLRALMKEFRRRVLEETVDLGDKFVEEALKIESGEAPDRAIRGQASAQDVRMLLEEGVRVLPVPRAPGDFN